MAELWGRAGGANRKIKKLYANVGGVNREIKQLWAKQNGVTREIFVGRGFHVSYEITGMIAHSGRLNSDGSGSFYTSRGSANNDDWASFNVKAIFDKDISIVSQEEIFRLNDASYRLAFDNEDFEFSGARVYDAQGNIIQDLALVGSSNVWTVSEQGTGTHTFYAQSYNNVTIEKGSTVKFLIRSHCMIHSGDDDNYLVWGSGALYLFGEQITSLN
jgi:hypothetical protein